MIRSLLTRLTRHLTPRIIYGRSNQDPYLSRYYLLGAPTMPDGSSPFRDGQIRKGATIPEGFGLYLHRFHRSDDDQALHSHPWSWAWSLILAGGYSEERRDGDVVIRRSVRPGRLIRILANDYHRVDLFEHDSWSLFFAGPKTTSWNFWDRDTGETWPWRTFIALKRGPGWDDERARDWKCGELIARARTAFAARDWFAARLGVERQTLRVEEAR